MSEAQRLPTSDLRNSYAWYLCQTDRMAQGLNELSPVLRDPLYGSLDKALVNASVCAARLEQYELADSYINAALAMRPDFATAYLYRGHLAVQKIAMARGASGLANDAKLLGDALKRRKRCGCSHALSMVRQTNERVRQSGCKSSSPRRKRPNGCVPNNGNGFNGTNPYF